MMSEEAKKGDKRRTDP